MSQERSGMQRNAFESNTEGTTAIRTMAIVLIILAAVCFAYAGSSDVKASDQIKHPTGGVILPDEEVQKDKNYGKATDKSGRLGVSLETVYYDGKGTCLYYQGTQERSDAGVQGGSRQG